MSLLQPSPYRNSYPSSLRDTDAPSRASRRIRLTGEQDASTCKALSTLLGEAMDHADIDILLDLTEVTFLDGATARVLIDVRDRLQSHGKHLGLLSPSPSTRRILVLCGLTDIIDKRSATLDNDVSIQAVRPPSNMPNSGENLL